jgi:hypothetical protein
MATLRLVPPTGTHIEIDGDQAVVGRDPMSDVVINDGSVSRKHARLERRGEGWAVVDQGSANGTFLDGHRVAEADLRNGQEIRFGSVGYVVEIEADGLGATILTPMPAPTDATVVGQRAVTAPPPRPQAPPAPRPVSPPPARPKAPPVHAPAPPSPRPHAVEPAAVPHVAHAPEPEKKRSPMFWGAVGCGGCLVVSIVGFLAIFGTAYFMTGGAVDAARAQLKDIKDGNIDAAYARTTAGYQADHSSAAFAALVERHPGLKGNTDSTFNNRAMENQTAKLTGTLAHAAGTENVVYRLVKEGEAWKISGLEVNGDEGAGGPTPSAEGGLAVETIAVNKVPQGQAIAINIDVRVSGFDLLPEGNVFRMDLAEDLETIGPDGRRIDALSKVGLETLNETKPSAVGATATFNNSLTFGKAEPGRYKAVITIRDLVGRKTKKHEVPFSLP